MSMSHVHAHAHVYIHTHAYLSVYLCLGTDFRPVVAFLPSSLLSVMGSPEPLALALGLAGLLG